MNFASWIIVGLLVLGFFLNLFWDIEGRPAKSPTGFVGVLGTLVMYALLAWLYYTAGIFGK